MSERSERLKAAADAIERSNPPAIAIAIDRQETLTGQILQLIDDERAARRRSYWRTGLTMYSLMALSTTIMVMSPSPGLNAALIVGTLVGSMMVALDVGVCDGE